MKRISLPGLVGLVLSLLVAAIIGLAIPVLPIKLTAVLAILVLGTLGFLIAVALPARAVVPYKIIYTIFVAAVMAKFLWPNFAYIPVPALPSKNPQRWVWALCLLYWVYSLLTNPVLRQRLAQRLATSRLAWVLLSLVAWRLISVGFSDQPLASIYTMATELFDYLPAFLFAITWVRDSRDAATLAKALIATSIIIGLITGIELVMQQNLFLKFAPHDISNEDFLLAALESKLRGGAYRAQASFNHPLLLAQFAVTAMPLVLFSVIRAERLSGRAFATAVFGLLLMVLWASRTRTAIVVAGIVFAALVLLLALNTVRNRTSGLHKPLLGGISLVGGVLILVFVAGILLFLTVGRSAEEAGSSMARVAMLKLAVKAAIEQPLFGYGPGVGNQHAAIFSSRGTGSLDSYFLTQLLESGIPAFILYSILISIGSFAFFKELRTRQSSREGMLSAMWSLSILAFGVSTLILSTPHNMPLLYLGIGVAVALTLPARPDSSIPTTAQYRKIIRFA